MTYSLSLIHLKRIDSITQVIKKMPFYHFSIIYTALQKAPEARRAKHEEREERDVLFSYVAVSNDAAHRSI
jgi:hypothetical protein